MRPGLTTALGGVLVCAGATLPWLSLYAGLQSYSGMTGLYGRLLFAGGALATVGSMALTTRAARWLRPGIGALGLVLALFTTWLLVGLRATTRTLGDHPLLVARPGPGLWVALVGAIAVTGALVPEPRGRTLAGPRRRNNAHPTIPLLRSRGTPNDPHDKSRDQQATADIA